MKKATLIAIVVTLSTVMFAGVNVTWGNTYAEDAVTGNLGSTSSFGVWFDVNDATSVGWENGLKVGVSGPADTSLRLGYDSGTTSITPEYLFSKYPMACPIAVKIPCLPSLSTGVVNPILR